jgi:hypothetical protein
MLLKRELNIGLRAFKLELRFIVQDREPIAGNTKEDVVTALDECLEHPVGIGCA